MAEAANAPLPEAANHMTLEVPSLAANAELCRIAVAVFAAALPFTLAELDQLKVAVSEAVANAALHAYPDAPGRVVVRAWFEGDAVWVEVRDWGRGIDDVARARQPAFTTLRDAEHMGLGFSFMEQFTDALEVDSHPGRGTVVRMCKRPHGPSGGGR
jgi:stage II sporulation protein AB (anti-sigma F factor)